MTSNLEIQVENLDHLGLVAGMIDEIGIIEQINQLVGEQAGEIVSPGHAVKAMILNGLGLVSSPLYLFSKFFEGKATEHLIGAGIKPEHLNDDRLGRVLDKLYMTGLEQIFTSIALETAKKFSISTETIHTKSGLTTPFIKKDNLLICDRQNVIGSNRLTNKGKIYQLSIN
jgi:transposase